MPPISSTQSDEASANAAVARYLNVPDTSRPASASESEAGDNGGLEGEGDGVAARTHGMMTRAMTAPHAGEEGTAREFSNQLDVKLDTDSNPSESPKRASTAPLVSDMEEARASFESATTASIPPEPRRDSLFTSEENQDMESLFSSNQSSPVDVERLTASSLVETEARGEGPKAAMAEERAMITPRSPSARPDASKQSDSTDSTKSDGSNSSFSEKLRNEVGQTKGQELPFSPNKAKRVPVTENPALAAARERPSKALLRSLGKENEHATDPRQNSKPVTAPAHSTSAPSKSRVKPQDRIGRARKFLQEKRLK